MGVNAYRRKLATILSDIVLVIELQKLMVVYVVCNCYKICSNCVLKYPSDMFREKPHLDSPLELPKIQMIFLRIMIHLSRLKGN